MTKIVPAITSVNVLIPQFSCHHERAAVAIKDEPSTRDQQAHDLPQQLGCARFPAFYEPSTTSITIAVAIDRITTLRAMGSPPPFLGFATEETPAGSLPCQASWM